MFTFRTLIETFCDQWLLQKKKKLEKNTKIDEGRIPDILFGLMEKNKQRYSGVDCKPTLDSLRDCQKLKSFNQHFVVGVNNITRCIEKNEEFALLLVSIFRRKLIFDHQLADVNVILMFLIFQ